MLTVAASGTVTAPVVAGPTALYGAPARRRRRVLILEPAPAISMFFADVRLTLRGGQSRAEQEAEEAALLGLIDFPESEEALEEELLGLPR